MAWTHALMQYQQADIERQSNQKRLGELAQLLKTTSASLSEQQRLEQAEEIAKKARQDQETLEFELGKVQTKLRMDSERLYSGRIVNSRELQDLQAETDSLKRHIASLEDKLLDAMLVKDDADTRVLNTSRELEQKKEQIAQNIMHLTTEQTTLKAHQEILTAQIEDLQQQIPASILDTYEYLKSRTGNMPVAQLKGEVCGVCGIEVRKPVQQKAQRNEEAYCGGCNRLLIVLN